MEAFGENVVRLMGLHRLGNTVAAALWGISPQSLSAWRTGTFAPSSSRLMAVATFFEVPAEALATESFEALLPVIADPDRYRRVEARIATLAPPKTTAKKPGKSRRKA